MGVGVDVASVLSLSLDRPSVVFFANGVGIYSLSDLYDAGSASLKTGFGEIEVGIASGTAAKLDASTSFGRVRNQLEAADGPQATDETLDLRARSSYGDIVVRRATGDRA